MAAQDNDLSADEKAELQKFAAMGLDERRQFWQEQFSRCLKCYACRAACPLCYCTRCTVECNQPQWIRCRPTTWATWNGTSCAPCTWPAAASTAATAAGPARWASPLYLLNQKLISDVFAGFNSRSGMAAKADNAMSTFKPNDPEDFIR